VYSNLLLLTLTWTAQRTFCKPLDSNLTNTMWPSEKLMLSGKRNTSNRNEESLSFSDEHLQTAVEGGNVEMKHNYGRLNRSGEMEMDILYSDYSLKSHGKEEDEIAYDKVSHDDDKPLTIRAGMMTLIKIDDEWLTEDQLPITMRNITGTGDEEDKIYQKINRGSPAKVNRRYHWPNRILYYHLKSWFSSWEKQQIATTLRRLEQKLGSNCVKFRRSNRWDALQVRWGDGCSATVGYVRNKKLQRMSLGKGCFDSGTIEHEFLHSLGVHHTQNHWDRDNYVTILDWNIMPGKKHNFGKQRKSKADSFGLPYDYYSVMHYAGKDWSENKNYPTIVTRDRRYQRVIGKSSGVSWGDIELIRKMYRCN